MKRYLSIAACCFALAPWVFAQVSVDLALEQEQFLPGEAIPIGVRITNYSGQTIHLGRDENWLAFSIERPDGSIVPMRGKTPVQGEFAVPSSSVATKRIDIAPYFELSQPGSYRVTATVELKDWSKLLASKPASFDIISGTTLWQQDVGLPHPPGQPPAVRQYALQQAINLKQMKLYVRVSDQSGSRVFRVFPIGPLISFSKPECQIDRTSNLHVLYQTGAKSFNYSVVNPNGVLLVRQTYEYTDTRPILKVDEMGRIYVSGGARRVASDDLPASVDTPNHDAQPPKP
jgi:hypothetical protein